MTEKQNFAANAQDCMAYLPGMEIIESDILEEVQRTAGSVDFNAFTERDVKAALMRKHKTVQDFAALLSPAAKGRAYAQTQNGTGFCGASFTGGAAVFGRNGAAGKEAYL